jgi:5-methylcytosine-specific restriction endonuclease McrA
MKSIDILGKRNIDKINKVKNPVRRCIDKWKVDDVYFAHNKQVEIVNSLYVNQPHEYEKIVKREVEKKIGGYKSQDIRNNILDLNRLISLDQVLEKLVVSKMKCCYCKDNCDILYKDVLYKKQWTLDRIDNDYGHNNNNVVICCYECNVKRGDMDYERFKQGKSIKFIRKQE